VQGEDAATIDQGSARSGDRALPTTRGAMTDHDDVIAWVERTAADLGRTLADPAVRAEVLALLDGHERDRARRLAAARAELAGLEVRWRLEEAWEP
jgi:predicted nucleic acid-binding protein